MSDLFESLPFQFYLCMQLTKEVTSIAPFLIPFLKMSCVYFVLWLPEDQPSITAAFVKALPILSLIWFVCLQGVTGEVHHSYNRRILIGLVFSVIGDVCLVWQEHMLLFLLGMVCFGFAQVSYILAFGFAPFGFKELVTCFTLGVPGMCLLIRDLPSFLFYPVFLYGIVLLFMNWRSLARFSINDEIPWRKIFAACGACLFLISDTFIALNKFVASVPGERTIIMVTYYAAQLCLSLSVVNSRLRTLNRS